jgi:hypothetical protein
LLFVLNLVSDVFLTSATITQASPSGFLLFLLTFLVILVLLFIIFAAEALVDQVDKDSLRAVRELGERVKELNL